MEHIPTGERKYLYSNRGGYRPVEMIFLDNERLYAGLENAFYSLETGERLELSLQYPDPHTEEYLGWEAARINIAVYPYPLAYARLPEGGHLVLRQQERVEGSKNQQFTAPLRVEAFDRDGSFLYALHTDFWPDMYPDMWGYIAHPLALKTELRDGYLYFTDNLLLLPSLMEYPPPGVVVLDLETLTWLKLGGTRWSLGEESIVTAQVERVGDGYRFSFYLYRNYQLADMFSWWFAQSGSDQWSIHYDEEAGTVEL